MGSLTCVKLRIFLAPTLLISFFFAPDDESEGEGEGDSLALLS